MGGGGVVRWAGCCCLLVLVGCASSEDDPAGGGRLNDAAIADGGGAGATRGDGSTGDAASAVGGDTADGGARDAALDGGGATDGAVSDGGGAGGDEDADVASCASTSPLNLLVLYDISGSMEEAWGTTTKFEGTWTAVRDALEPFKGLVTAGAMFFPTMACLVMPPASGAVAPIDMAPQIDFRSGSSFLTAWEAYLGPMTASGIGTPLQETMDRAELALADEASLPGDRTIVLLVTDGEGNCFDDEAITGVPVDTEVNRASAWAGRGIATHVVDLGAPATMLADIATAAGTTLMQPTDPSELRAKLTALFDDATCP